VADFDDDGIEIDDGIDCLEAAVLPGLDLFHNGVGGVGDEGGGDFDLVDFKEVFLDFAHSEAAGVEADDGPVEAVEVALVLGNEGWLKVAGAVAGDKDGQLAVPGAEGLGAVAVAYVGLSFGRFAMLFVAEVGGHLAFEDAVDEALLQLGKQPVGA
jgi:hypothetical protein